MLSAFAARRGQPPTPTLDDLSRSGSEAENSVAGLKVPAKRKSDSVEESSSSRKRKRSSKTTKESRHFENETNGLTSKAPAAPLREYSPSMPVALGQENRSEPLNVDPVISTFSPSLNQNVFFEDTSPSDICLYLALTPSETLSFIGTVSLEVLQGGISLFGSLLRPSATQHSIYAPKSYPTATLRALEPTQDLPEQSILPPFLAALVEPSHTVIRLSDLHSGVQGLGRVCGTQQSAFEATSDVPFDFKLREFHPMIHATASQSLFQVSPSWTDALEHIESSSECPALLVKGPKNSGKSMFARLLLNHLLLRHKYVAYLDCDPGQTEFTPPGLVSLHLLSQPILGPAFTHLRQPFRAHFIGSTTIRTNSSHYHECVTALLDTYRLSIKYGLDIEHVNETSPHSEYELSDNGDINSVPLIINTFGWTKSQGAESIQHIGEQAEVTHIFSFESTTQDSVWRMDDALQIPDVHYFSMEPVLSSRFDQNPASKRDLMTMSYFHCKEGTKPSTWNTDTPLCAMPPWEVTWSQAIDRIILIGNGSEDVHRSEVLRVLNGAIVALVAIDSSLPNWSQSKETLGNPPYIQGGEPPSPSFSHCIGYALVRSVRASNGTLQILTPVSPDQLEQSRAIVMGDIKLPIWGMLDHRAESRSAGQIAGVDVGAVPFLQWTTGPQDAAGARQLRVRRNLMRKAQL